MLRAPDKMRMEGQMADGAEPLAIVLSRWIRRERLRPQDIERASGISRNHLWLMTHGKVTRPTPETLRRLALALATDPHDLAVVDRLKRDEALHELSRAAGYADLTADVDEGELVRAVLALVGNQQSTEFWIEMMRTHGAVSPTLQNLLRAVADLYDRPGGADVTGFLLRLGDADQATRDEMIRRLTGDGEVIRG